MSWDTIRLDWDGEVATLVVDRPDRMNALDAETLDAMEEAVERVREESARCLVLTGAGEEAFVAGADIEQLREFDPAAAQAYAERGHRIAAAVESLPAPTVAAVNGYAFGGGCELALACDLRVASERALLGQTEIDLGVIPGWGGTQRLPALVGDETARRMIFFGERVDATDAYQRGLVGEVVAHDELYDRVGELTGKLAEKPRNALHAAKEALNAFHDAPRSAALEHEARAWSGLFGTADQKEGMDAFLTEREPEFD